MVTLLEVLLSFCICCTLVNPYSIGVVDRLIQLVDKAQGFNLLAPENNHDKDFTRGLFAVNEFDRGRDPPFLIEPPGFNYTIENRLGQWILYSHSSFDYEKDPRSYVIRVGFGYGEWKILKLLIQNIDDEPPALVCPDNITMVENLSYDVNNSSAICWLSDPDGFLNQTTFKLTGTYSDNFEMKLPVKYDEFAQTTEAIITKKAFESDGDVYLTIQAKDGAGHSTVPKAKIDVKIKIIKDTK
ncbi:unnamed protein product [Phyllotreta striolata]|uniref:Uncharacterized protein n=1 Tax=Phyllotreta striolata TaxID=444603 RepID=A0A9N9TIU0_PHYSR|nr:unnamed protein product [Phyllotreta striolata]